MDQQLFLAVFSFTQGIPLFVEIANFFAVYGIWILYAVIVVGLFFPEKYSIVSKKVATTALLAFVISLITKELFVHIFPSPRPGALLGISPSINEASYELYRSFPSAHALSSFAIASVVFLSMKRFGTLLFILAICIAIARVAVGVHFPEDVLAGSLLGIGIGIIADRVMRNR